MELSIGIITWEDELEWDINTIVSEVSNFTIISLSIDSDSKWNVFNQSFITTFPKSVTELAYSHIYI